MYVVISTKPMPAPRVRVTRWGAYNEPRYTEHKKIIQYAFQKENMKISQSALKMKILFQFKKPKSWTKKKKCEAYWHTQRGDIDNLTKSVLDALNGIAYKDDSQICDLDAMKIWGECDKIIVEIEEL